MSNCKLVATPLAIQFKLSDESCPTSAMKIEKMSHVLYSSVTGSLMYAMVCTRSNLAYAVSMASCYMHNHGKDH